VSTPITTAVAAAVLLLTNMSPQDRAEVIAAFPALNPFEEFQEVGFDYDADHFYTLRVEFSRLLNEDEISQVSGCIGYAFKARIRGEQLSEPTILSNTGRAGTVLEFDYDTTKTRSDDPDFTAAFDDAATYIELGSPKRTTNNAGPGTKGTRLVEGLNDGTKVRFYVR
jgi:hypothetical protein